MLNEVKHLYRKMTIFAPLYAPIVEWIEFQIPVLTVAVRFRMGVQKKQSLAALFFVFI